MNVIVGTNYQSYRPVWIRIYTTHEIEKYFSSIRNE